MTWADQQLAAWRAAADRSGYPYVWHWRSRHGDRKGQRCAVVVRSRRMNSAAVVFPDGFVTITSRNAVRRAQ